MNTKNSHSRNPDENQNHGRQSIERKTLFEQPVPGITSTNTLPVTTDAEEQFLSSSMSDVVPIKSEKRPTAPAGETISHPIASETRAADMPEKTIVMPTEDVFSHTPTDATNISDVDQTIVMPSDGVAQALSRTSHNSIDPEKTMSMDGAMAKALTQHQKMTFKQSLTASFRTGTLQIFDKAEDVDQVIHNQKNIPAKTALHKETEAPLAMDDVNTSFELGKEFAAGGQGILSIGTDRHLKRPVAIKSLRKE